MSATTYFADVITQGNTILKQNLTVSGSYIYFVSNIGGAQTIGTASVPFGNLYASSANTTTLNAGIIQIRSGVTNFGNVFASNAYQGGNLFATSMNASNFISLLSLITNSNVGIGTTGGANLTVQGNAFISNSITFTNLFSTYGNVSGTANVQSLLAISIGSGGANLNVTGNAWVSNSILATNIYATTLNTATLNTSTLLTSSTATSNALNINGNVFVSNTVTVPNITSSSLIIPSVNVTTMNVQTVNLSGSTLASLNVFLLNVQSIYTPSGLLGVNVDSGSIGATLQVQGNLFGTNTFSGSNLSVTNTIYYNEDLTRRSIHLIPSSANSSAIQSWISATCNASSQPSKSYWCTSQTPLYGNGVQAGTGYSGGVYLPDGRVVFSPTNIQTIGIYNSTNFSFTNVSITGLTSGNFTGGVLLPTGNVLFGPQNSNVGQFNPVSLQFSNITTVLSGEYGTILTANGIIFNPAATSSNVVNYNYTTGVFSNVLSVPTPPTSLGSNWTTATTAVSGDWYGVSWSPQLGLFVAVGSNSPYFVYSTDGKNWTSSTSSVSGIWLDVTWSPQLGLLVAGSSGSPYFAYSTDGKNWTTATTAVSGNWNGVLWSPQLGLFAALGTASPYFVYSTDGKNWTAATTSVSGSWQGVSWSPQLGTFAAVGSSGVFAYTANAFPTQLGSVLLPSGNVMLSLPGSSNIIQLDPVSLYNSNIIVGTGGYNGLVLAANGNVIAVPKSSNVLVINPTTQTSSNVGPIGASTSSFFSGGVLTPSGNVFFVPGTSSNVGVFDPISLTYSNSTPCGAQFSGGVLLPSGQIILAPSISTNVGIIDTFTPAPQEWCLSPYFNKF
jgi:hypothetical protein